MHIKPPNKIINLQDKDLAISFLSVFSGLLVGLIMYTFLDNGTRKEIFELFIDFNTIFTNKTTIEILSGIVLYGLLYFIILFILGGSFLGSVAAPIVTLIKSAGLTLIVSNLYCEYALKGLEYTLLVFFPGKCILILAMLLMTKNCIATSRKIIYNDKDTQVKNITDYSIKSLIILIIFLFSWITDFGLIKVFSNLFNFK